ncbi:MAG: hypothetical protein ABI876_04820 [Bacteroidota bacterium]
MGLITWMIILGGMSFMLWYGFNLLVRRPGIDASGDGPGPVASCHLCRRNFPIRHMVSRDKMAGFVNYFCGDCVEGLYNDYVGAQRDGTISPMEKLREGISRN